MEMDGATLRSQLMLLKSTSFVKTWNGSGDATEVRSVMRLSPGVGTTAAGVVCDVLSRAAFKPTG